MMRHRCLGLGALGLACALLPWAAHAATVASATISNLQFTLVDLDQNDGITPAIVWDGPYAVVEATRFFDQRINISAQAGGALWDVSFGSSSVDSSSSDSGVLDGLSGNREGVTAMTSPTSLAASATTGAGGVSLTGFAYASGSFSLTAQTELRISGQIDLAVSGPGSTGYRVPGGVAVDQGVPFSSASAYAELFLDSASATRQTGGVAYAPNALPGLYPIDSFASGEILPLYSVLSNPTGSGVVSSFYVLTQVSAMELSPSVVPEPAAWALLLGGVTALGALKRMRRS